MKGTSGNSPPINEKRSAGRFPPGTWEKVGVVWDHKGSESKAQKHLKTRLTFFDLRTSGLIFQMRKNPLLKILNSKPKPS